MCSIYRSKPSSRAPHSPPCRPSSMEDERREASMTAPRTEPNILDRYQDYRTRRFLKNERRHAHSLPGWRSQARRRMLVVGLAVTFAFMLVVGILCALGLQ